MATLPLVLQSQVVLNLKTYFQGKAPVRQFVCFGTTFDQGIRRGCKEHGVPLRDTAVYEKNNSTIATVVQITEVVLTYKPPHMIVLITSFCPSLLGILTFVTSHGYDVILISSAPCPTTLPFESHDWKSFHPKQSTRSISSNEREVTVKLSNSQTINIVDSSSSEDEDPTVRKKKKSDSVSLPIETPTSSLERPSTLFPIETRTTPIEKLTVAKRTHETMQKPQSTTTSAPKVGPATVPQVEAITNNTQKPPNSTEIQASGTTVPSNPVTQQQPKSNMTPEQERIAQWFNNYLATKNQPGSTLGQSQVLPNVDPTHLLGAQSAPAGGFPPQNPASNPSNQQGSAVWSTPQGRPWTQQEIDASSYYYYYYPNAFSNIWDPPRH